MEILQHTIFIKNFPYRNQAFTIQRANWESPYQKDRIAEIFDGKEQITLNRFDLINTGYDLPVFIFKTLMWGYPTKGRGTNIDTLLEPENYNRLVEMLKSYQEGSISLEKFRQDTKSIPNLGLSTASKFAYFLRTNINGKKALILDRKIIQALSGGTFKELNELKSISDYNAFSKYGKYLETMHDLALKMDVEPDQLEIFLFYFGRNLSEVVGEEGFLEED